MWSTERNSTVSDSQISWATSTRSQASQVQSSQGTPQGNTMFSKIAHFPFCGARPLQVGACCGGRRGQDELPIEDYGPVRVDPTETYMTSGIASSSGSARMPPTAQFGLREADIVQVVPIRSSHPGSAPRSPPVSNLLGADTMLVGDDLRENRRVCAGTIFDCGIGDDSITNEQAVAHTRRSSEQAAADHRPDRVVFEGPIYLNSLNRKFWMVLRERGLLSIFPAEDLEHEREVRACYVWDITVTPSGSQGLKIDDNLKGDTVWYNTPDAKKWQEAVTCCRVGNRKNRASGRSYDNPQDM